jgi:hypothetical protein
LFTSLTAQAVLDLHDAVSERLRLLDMLRSGSREHLEQGTQQTGSAVEQAKCTAAGAVAATERAIKQVLYICELVSHWATSLSLPLTSTRERGRGG